MEPNVVEAFYFLNTNKRKYSYDKSELQEIFASKYQCGECIYKSD